MANEGDLKVWWIPQVPMEPMFEVEVNSVKEAILIIDTLARYDQYQYENNIKPDFCNAGGLLVLEDGEWIDWHDEDDNDIDFYLDEGLELENV